MSAVLTRLSRLEEDDLAQGDLGFGMADLDTEARRWDELLVPAAEGLSREAADKLSDAAEAEFKDLWGLLIAAENGRSGSTPEGVIYRIRNHRRWPAAAATFIRAVPEATRSRVIVDGFTRPDDPYMPTRGWLDSWLLDLQQVLCRIPPDITPETFAIVLGPYLEIMPEGTHPCFPGVCEGCGLRHYTMYAVGFKCKCRDTPKVCPHCGREGHLWPISRLNEKRFGWISLAEQELGGFGSAR
jgi:hypothetical protein